MKKLASLVLLGLVLVGCSNSGSGDVMTMEEAQKIALEEVDGEVIKSSKDRDDGRTYYEFEIVTDSEKYDLEYGTNEVFMHADSILPGQNVIIVDDLLATGGTVEATVKLVERLGGKVARIAFFIELEALEGRKRLQGYNVYSMLKY